MFKRKCDYCGEKFKRKELRVWNAGDILLDYISCEPCAIRNGSTWVK